MKSTNFLGLVGIVLRIHDTGPFDEYPAPPPPTLPKRVDPSSHFSPIISTHGSKEAAHAVPLTFVYTLVCTLDLEVCAWYGTSGIMRSTTASKRLGKKGKGKGGHGGETTSGAGLGCKVEHLPRQCGLGKGP